MVHRAHRVDLEQVEAGGAQVHAVDGPVVQPRHAQGAAVAHALAQDPRGVGQGAPVLPGHPEHVEVVVGLGQPDAVGPQAHPQVAAAGPGACHQAAGYRVGAGVHVEAVVAQEARPASCRSARRRRPRGWTGPRPRRRRRCPRRRPSGRSRSPARPETISTRSRQRQLAGQGRARRPPCPRRCGGRCPRARAAAGRRRRTAPPRAGPRSRRTPAGPPGARRAARAGPRDATAGPSPSGAQRTSTASRLARAADAAGRRAGHPAGLAEHRGHRTSVTVTTLKCCSPGDVVAVGDPRDGARRHDALRDQEAGGQLEVVTRRAHGDRDGRRAPRAVGHADLHRLLARQAVAAAAPPPPPAPRAPAGVARGALMTRSGRGRTDGHQRGGGPGRVARALAPATGDRAGAGARGRRPRPGRRRARRPRPAPGRPVGHGRVGGAGGRHAGRAARRRRERGGPAGGAGAWSRDGRSRSPPGRASRRAPTPSRAARSYGWRAATVRVDGGRRRRAATSGAGARRSAPARVLLGAGHRVAPHEVGALGAAGHAAVRCVRRPRVAILATGAELVALGAAADPSQVHDSSRHGLAAQAVAAGAAGGGERPRRRRPASATEAALAALLDATGPTAAGRDRSPTAASRWATTTSCAPALARLGVEELVRGVRAAARAADLPRTRAATRSCWGCRATPPRPRSRSTCWAGPCWGRARTGGAAGAAGRASRRAPGRAELRALRRGPGRAHADGRPGLSRGHVARRARPRSPGCGEDDDGAAGSGVRVSRLA